jgi:hypothetical protein
MRPVEKKIELTGEERIELEKFTKSGVHGANMIRRARVVLALDSSAGRIPRNDAETARECGVSLKSVQNIKDAFLGVENLEDFLLRKKRKTPPVAPKVTGDVEARIIALSCGEPPEGYARWTVRLIAEKCVELEIVDSISAMTVSRTLKKTTTSPT